MEVSFVSEVEVTCSVEPNSVTVHEASVFLSCSKNIPLEQFFEERSTKFNKKGCDTITMCLVNGLIGNIHFAHENGFIDSAAHLRHIIEKLEEGFVKQLSFQEYQR